MTDKTPTLTEQELETLKAVAEKATPGPWEAENAGECAWGVVTSDRYIVDNDFIAPHNARHVAAFNPETALRLLATLTAERERADRAESHANAAETQAGIDRVLRRAAEAENARLLERLRAIDPLVLIEGTEDGFHQYRCVACHRGSRPDHADARHFDSCIFWRGTPTAPTGDPHAE
jgi:hypothetical protein